ncbi:transmembrane protein 237A-like [Actinia tenebrosa]|uniref:Transmembrane protein 237A-like n=1 Tax=Actinia tenebrosa TaxID=6105 RepID=A0A6P8HSJ0_ACTTE|nr:transmembrane protein 237A-like [Actinia tenebrosa]
MLQSDQIPMASTTGPSPLHGSFRERQRRRKKRISRDLDDHNESLESPSSIPERIPLHEMADGEKANASAEGSSSLTHGGHERTSRSRERSRRPRRKSRTENGDLHDRNELQMHTLDIPDKRRHKRPPMASSRHAPRSASAEVLNRMEDDIDGENLSPTRGRNRRRRGHGSKDIIENDDMDEYGIDGGVPGENPKRPRPRKHKTKKPSRQQNATSGEEENYNADMDGEVSMVDTFKVDKEDIVAGEPAPPSNPSLSQTLPSQPLDVVFIQTRDGHGFKSERKTRINQLEEERRTASPMEIEREKTTAEFAVSVHRAFRSFSLFCHGLLAGFALCQCIFVYSLSDHVGGDKIFLEYYCKMAQPIQSIYYMLFALCTVSVFDRYDMANPRSGFFQGLLNRPSRILSISAYLFALVFSISVANIDDRISLYKSPQNLWESEETTSLLETWRIINLMRVLGAIMGWILVALQPTKDYTAQNLYEGNQLGDDVSRNTRPGDFYQAP